jgi:hypothetical protein
MAADIAINILLAGDIAIQYIGGGRYCNEYILIGCTYCNTIYWWSQILQSIYRWPKILQCNILHVTDIQASSNVAYRILALNKLFRSKNRFYLDLFRAYAKVGARRSRELRDGLQSLELLRMHDTFQRKVHQCGTILVPLPTKYRTLFLDRW